jgi:hypothetical protein
MTLPPLRRVRSSWVEAISFVPLKGKAREEYPRHGILRVKLKDREGTTLYLIPSSWYGCLCSRRVSVGKFLNNHVLRGKVPGEKAN